MERATHAPVSFRGVPYERFGGGSGSVLTLSSTAATGAPITGQAVTATCKSGTATVTTNSNGSYTADIVGGEGPCLLKITLAGGGALYSITSGSGASQTANMTPMTNLLVSYRSNVPGITAASPETWFAQPAARTLLASTTNLKTRITNDFIPACGLAMTREARHRERIAAIHGVGSSSRDCHGLRPRDDWAGSALRSSFGWRINTYTHKHGGRHEFNSLEYCGVAEH